MSTQYGIVKEFKGYDKKYDDDNDIFIIGGTWGFNETGEIIEQYLNDDTPIIPVGNSTDIKTIKELRKYYNIVNQE